MDSLSHTRVAKLLLAYVQEICGVTFDEAGFFYGNLKPDLTGTYITKRHYPSIMYDEVMEKLQSFLDKYTICTAMSCRSIWVKSAIILPIFSVTRITMIFMTATC